jgi:hypothetical protein
MMMRPAPVRLFDLSVPVVVVTGSGLAVDGGYPVMA